MQVPPPAAVIPDDKSVDYPWNRLGPRVPAILISPWCNPGGLHVVVLLVTHRLFARVVDHTVFDHTSVLRSVGFFVDSLSSHYVVTSSRSMASMDSVVEPLQPTRCCLC